MYNVALDDATVWQHYAAGAVPEPASAVLLGFGGLALLFGLDRRRRRQTG